MYCRRRDCDRIIVLMGSIEPLTVLSHHGEIERAGAIVLGDIDLQSLRGTLSDNQQKLLFDTRSGGTIKCKRWHPIPFPPNLPRLISLNGDIKDWLEVFGEPTAHDIAKMRRVVIGGYSKPFSKTDRLISDSGKQKLQDFDDAEAQKELQREQEWRFGYWIVMDLA